MPATVACHGSTPAVDVAVNVARLATRSSTAVAGPDVTVTTSPVHVAPGTRVANAVAIAVRAAGDVSCKVAKSAGSCSRWVERVGDQAEVTRQTDAVERGEQTGSNRQRVCGAHPLDHGVQRGSCLGQERQVLDRARRQAGTDDDPVAPCSEGGDLVQHDLHVVVGTAETNVDGDLDEAHLQRRRAGRRRGTRTADQPSVGVGQDQVHAQAGRHDVGTERRGRQAEFDVTGHLHAVP